MRRLLSVLSARIFLPVTALMGFALSAYAQQQQSGPPASAPMQGFAPPPGDPALDAFGRLFGNVGGLNFFPGDADGQISQMFLVFNTAVISVAALFFLWNVITSTINAAHDGEFLGRRYHSFWMPFRNVYGVFSLMPVFAGWSFAQIFMAWAIWAGTGIANGVHSTSREVIEVETRQYAALPERPDFFKITADLYKLGDELLRHKQQQRLDIKDGVSSSVAPYVDLEFAMYDYRDAQGTVWVYAGANLPDGAQVQGYTNNNIGAVPVTFTRPPADYTQSRELQDAHELAVRQELRTIIDWLNSQVQRLSSMDTLGDEFQAAWPHHQASQFKYAAEATARYIGAMAEARQRVADHDVERTNGDAFSTKYGWFGAGMGIVDGASMSMESAGTATGSRFTRGDAPKAEVDLGGGPGFGTLYRRNFEQMWSDIKETYSKSWDQIGSGVGGTAAGVGNATVATVALLLTPAAAALPSALDIESTGDTVSDIGKLVASLNQGMRKVVNELAVTVLQMLQVAANPLAAMQHMGIGILNVVQMIFNVLVTTAASAFLLAAVSFGAAGSIFVALVVFMLPAFIAIAIFGIKLAVLLPFMPVILWLGAILNYIVITIESLFGAQLWALVHLDPDGEGMGQKATHGYVFLLNLLFRPAMMVICLALAYKLLSIMAGLGIEALSGPLVKMISAGGDNWIVPLAMILGVIWLFISLMEMLVHTCFAMVNVVPGQVVTWIGGTFGSNVGSDLDRSVDGGAKGMAQTMGSLGTNAALHGVDDVRRAGPALGKFVDDVKDRPSPLKNADGSIVKDGSGNPVMARPSEVRAAQERARQHAIESYVAGSAPVGSQRPPTGGNPPSGGDSPPPPPGRTNSITGNDASQFSQRRGK